MSQQRLSQHSSSIELSDISTRHSSVMYHSNSSISQSQGLLTQPPEYESIHDAFANEANDTPDLHDTPSTIPPSRQGRRFWRRIGTKGLVMIPLGSILLLVSIIFPYNSYESKLAKRRTGKNPISSGRQSFSGTGLREPSLLQQCSCTA